MQTLRKFIVETSTHTNFFIYITYMCLKKWGIVITTMSVVSLLLSLSECKKLQVITDQHWRPVSVLLYLYCGIKKSGC